MKRLWGLVLFCIGVGMAVKVLIPTTLGLLFFITGLLVVGYHLFGRCLAAPCRRQAAILLSEILRIKNSRVQDPGVLKYFLSSLD